VIRGAKPSEIFDRDLVSIIVVRDPAKRFGGYTAVHSISFESRTGQVTALFSPNVPRRKGLQAGVHHYAVGSASGTW
jgi:hypothetical protein